MGKRFFPWSKRKLMRQAEQKDLDQIKVGYIRGILNKDAFIVGGHLIQITGDTRLLKEPDHASLDEIYVEEFDDLK